MSNTKKVKEQIAKILCQGDGRNWDALYDKTRTLFDGIESKSHYFWLANQILAIPGLLVKAEDQSLPEKLFIKFKTIPDEVVETAIMAYQQAQTDMLELGWVKVEPKVVNERRAND